MPRRQAIDSWLEATAARMEVPLGTTASPFRSSDVVALLPQCLGELDERWLLAWRLGLVVCLRPASLSTRGRVPGLPNYQRRQQTYRAVPKPATCACGYELVSTRVTTLSADHTGLLHR
jgi:hypothetical protein